MSKNLIMNIKKVLKSKYFIILLIEIIFISVLTPSLFNCFLAKEEDLLKLLNEFGIHYFTIFLILVSFLWTLFVVFLLKTTNKIDNLIKENKKSS